MTEEKSNLKSFKEKYEILRVKYLLPGFDEFAKDFPVEKLSEFETDHILRDIKLFSSEKFFNYFRFVESLLSPSNSSMFIFSVVKTFGEEDKNKLQNLYKKFSELELEYIESDLDVSEKKDAEFIKKLFIEWQEMKLELASIINKVRNNLGNKTDKSRKNYFG